MALWRDANNTCISSLLPTGKLLRGNHSQTKAAQIKAGDEKGFGPAQTRRWLMRRCWQWGMTGRRADGGTEDRAGGAELPMKPMMTRLKAWVGRGWRRQHRSEGPFLQKRTPVYRAGANIFVAILLLLVIFVKWQMGKNDHLQTVNSLEQHWHWSGPLRFATQSKLEQNSFRKSGY